jgi:outer membrane protein OmpA-like peptidoglycan-associated protein
MNWKIVVVLLSSMPLLLTGCSSKEKNFVILDPGGDGQVGALSIETEKGSTILDEEGKAVYIPDRNSPPSEPTAVNLVEKQKLFKEALQVHPLPPQSFLLYFKQNSEELTDGSENMIPAIVEAIQSRNSGDIAIIGHTDRLGDESYNRILSMERAQVVYDLLRAQNVKGEEMTILYYGESNPLIPTADEVAEPKNRRVEVVIR